MRYRLKKTCSFLVYIISLVLIGSEHEGELLLKRKKWLYGGYLSLPDLFVHLHRELLKLQSNPSSGDVERAQIK
ncbi:MAG: hypothetical protein AB1414_17405 [bacterium]